jgi:hypothetical protein
MDIPYLLLAVAAIVVLPTASEASESNQTTTRIQARGN